MNANISAKFFPTNYFFIIIGSKIETKNVDQTYSERSIKIFANHLDNKFLQRKKMRLQRLREGFNEFAYNAFKSKIMLSLCKLAIHKRKHKQALKE